MTELEQALLTALEALQKAYDDHQQQWVTTSKDLRTELEGLRQTVRSLQSDVQNLEMQLRTERR